MTSKRTVPDTLRRFHPVLRSALRDAVERLAPMLDRVVAYHLGWRDHGGRQIKADGGKAVRPAIAFLAAEAVGAEADAAVPGAVAVELIHNFSLLHDDVIDGDAERRRRPTAWALFGAGQAVMAGDAMAALAYEILVGDPSPRAGLAAREFSRAMMEMIIGQSLDVWFESRLDVTERECLEMSARKTGALFSCAAVVGAVLGGGTGEQVEALRAWGRNVGISFQATDDVLGIWGREAVTGKPAGSDLRRSKKTLPVVYALRGETAAGKRLKGLLSSPELNARDVALAMDLLEARGSRAWTEALADRHMRLAAEALDGVDLRLGPVAELGEITRFVVRRDC